MKIVKYMAWSLVGLAVVALGVDCYILHRDISRLQEQIKIERDNDPILKAVAELKVEFAGFATELKSFEKFTAEKDEELVKAVNKLEDWVETSSVQGKWNGYKRQLGDYEARMEARYRQAKDSLQKKIDAMKLKYQKIRDVLAE